MLVHVTPLTDFQHGHLSFREGRPTQLEEVTAEALERRGLLRIGEPVVPPREIPPERTREAPPRRTQEAPPHRTQVVPDPDPGKAPADGQGTPSASLPPARVSPATIAPPLKRGPGRPRKSGT